MLPPSRCAGPAGQGCAFPPAKSGRVRRLPLLRARPRAAYCTKKPIWQDRGDPTRRCPPEVAWHESRLARPT